MGFNKILGKTEICHFSGKKALTAKIETSKFSAVFLCLPARWTGRQMQTGYTASSRAVPGSGAGAIHSAGQADNSRDELPFHVLFSFPMYFRREAHRAQSTNAPRKQPPEMQKAVLSV